MSLITSCPACGTMFRVVPDQLKISEGWVRCGHCSEVFDASAHLADDTAVPAPVAPPTPAVPQAAPEAAIRGWESTAAAPLASAPAALAPAAGEEALRPFTTLPIPPVEPPS
ncbi:MAG TPA: zinc-ribbon domain-containing protein, partial [Ramlibacter sp.]